MSNVFVEETKLQDIADAIREKNGTEETYKPAEMGDAVRAIESGDNFYNEFWDAYQQEGERTSYDYCFYGYSWTEETVKPKYDICPTSAQSMFQNSKIVDIKKLFEDLGIKVDFSKATYIANLFQGAKAQFVFPLDCSSLKSFEAVFRNNYDIKEVNILNLRSDCSISSTAFAQCKALETLNISGSLNSNLYLKESLLLSNESIQNIINCMVDLTGGTAKILTVHTDVKAKLTETQIAAITSKNWTLA